MIRLLIVDDSAVVRKVLSEELSKYPDIDVIGTAIDPYMARDKIVKLRPDVLTLDLEMPRMDGLSFLAKLMKHYPLPVVVVSSVAPANSDTAVKALALGAMEVVSKPGSPSSTPDVSKQLIRAIRAAAQAKPRAASPPEHTPAPPARGALKSTGATSKIIAIGASTGGTLAIEAVLTSFPESAPGTVIVQHMPEHFTAAFAKRLNLICAPEIREAKQNDRVEQGVVLIAPGGYHMILARDAGGYLVKIKDGPQVHHQKPAVDVLFQSVARTAGRGAVGVVLTGMGADGAKGLLAMREAGSATAAQDEKTSVVFGMPKQALALGAAERVLPLPDVAAWLLGQAENQKKAA